MAYKCGDKKYTVMKIVKICSASLSINNYLLHYVVCYKDIGVPIEI